MVKDENVCKQMTTEQFLDNCNALCPVKTLGDGDCLSHAVMMALCGISDRSSLFRHLMQLVLAAGNRVSLILRRVIEREYVRLAQEWCREGRRSHPRGEHAQCAASPQCCVFNPIGDNVFWTKDVCEPCRPARKYNESPLVRLRSDR